MNQPKTRDFIVSCILVMSAMSARELKYYLLDNTPVPEYFSNTIAELMLELSIPVENTRFGVSNGNSCAVIPKDSAVVYHFYRYKETFDNIIRFCHVIEDCPYLVKINSVIPERQCIIFDKLTPINVLYPNMNRRGKDISDLQVYITENRAKLKEQIGAALVCIAEKGWQHNDVSLDNIGLDSSGNFILFDFDGARQPANLDEDIRTLDEHTDWLMSRKVGGRKTRKQRNKRKQTK